jgi:hypothetical protein
MTPGLNCPPVALLVKIKYDENIKFLTSVLFALVVSHIAFDIRQEEMDMAIVHQRFHFSKDGVRISLM